jgi:hypothetical protein
MQQNLTQQTADQIAVLYANWQQTATEADGKFSDFLALMVQNFQMEEEGYTMGTA